MSSLPATANPAAEPAPIRLTRAQVDSEQLVEQYLAGKLQLRAKLALEQFFRDNPKFVDEIALSQRLHAGLRLVEAAGRPEPWNEQKAWFWTTHWFAGGATALVLALGIFAWQASSLAASTQRQLDKATITIKERPLIAAGSSRSVTVAPAANAPTDVAMLTLGGRDTEFVTMNLDVKRFDQDLFTLEIERVDQGRVALIRHLRRDSNGMISWSLNSSALGPGMYVVRIFGVNWRSQAIEVGGASFEVAPPRA
jgi:hypothetical protein